MRARPPPLLWVGADCGDGGVAPENFRFAQTASLSARPAAPIAGAGSDTCAVLATAAATVAFLAPARVIDGSSPPCTPPNRGTAVVSRPVRERRPLGILSPDDERYFSCCSEGSPHPQSPESFISCRGMSVWFNDAWTTVHPISPRSPRLKQATRCVYAAAPPPPPPPRWVPRPPPKPPPAESCPLPARALARSVPAWAAPAAPQALQTAAAGQPALRAGYPSRQSQYFRVPAAPMA
eukprot:TRINITY_DN32167_c0_g1_i1.p1 TRINITY_DN32167_c0_g1~~TRINITY_DN32167_c0_g1_i1.p1  ORF type:complete len:237 (+),score=33.63 TRINITY_DN32167_c0_g1_i1:106-816(+)